MKSKYSLFPKARYFWKEQWNNFKGHASTATHDISNNTPDPQQYLPQATIKIQH